LTKENSLLAFNAFVGIDPSLTNTGIAVYRTDVMADPGIELSSIESTGKKTDSWNTRGKRLQLLTSNVLDEVPVNSLVVIESPSYGSRGGAAHDRAGLWWAIHAELRSEGSTVICAAPSQRMKYVTGKGRADKDTVLAHTIRRYPELDITNNNTADAVIFMAMAARLAGHPIEHGTDIKAMDEVTQKLATQLEDH
jgi:Holliday junction resolvasome RuvABC endonuclease subunit